MSAFCRFRLRSRLRRAACIPVARLHPATALAACGSRLTHVQVPQSSLSNCRSKAAYLNCPMANDAISKELPITNAQNPRADAFQCNRRISRCPSGCLVFSRSVLKQIRRRSFTSQAPPDGYSVELSAETLKPPPPTNPRQKWRRSIQTGASSVAVVLHEPLFSHSAEPIKIMFATLGQRGDKTRRITCLGSKGRD